MDLDEIGTCISRANLREKDLTSFLFNFTRSLKTRILEELA